MTKDEVIRELEIYTVGRPKDFRPFISVGQLQNLLDVIKKLPVEKTSKWIEVDTNMYTCSNCSHCFSIVPEDNQIWQFNYCPNCGSKMENEVEND